MGRAKRWGIRAVLFAVSVWVAGLPSALWAGPVITEVQVTGVTDTTATVTWTTNEAADSRVDYGLTTSLGDSVSDSATVTAHSLTLTGLQGCRLYFFSVTSTGASGTTTDDNGGLYHTFTTLYRDAPLPLDDVEGGSGDWAVTTTGGSAWAIDTCRASSESHAWKAGEHDAPACTAGAQSSSDTSLRHSLTLGTGSPNYVLTWKEWLDTNDSDACRVKIFSGSAVNLLEPYGGTTDWRNRAANLTGYTGDVGIWFDLVTSAATPAGEGWYIDDIEVSRLLPCGGQASAGAVTYADACGGTGSGADGVLDPGETAEVSVQVVNVGTLDATNVSVSLSTIVPGISISPASQALGTLEPLGGSLYKADASFTLTLSRGIACGAAVDLTLVLQSDQNLERKTIRYFVGDTPDPWEENFDAGLPATWQALDLVPHDPPQTWQAESGRAPTGTADPYMILDSDGFGEEETQDAVLVTPTIDCSEADSVQMAFDTLFWSVEDGTDSAAVEVSGDGGTTWTEVTLWQATVGVDPETSEPNGEAARVILDLSTWLAGAPEAKVRFRYRGTWALHWIVDNVTVTLRNAESSCTTTVCCGKPTGLSAPAATDVDGACADSGVGIAWAQDPATAWGDEGMSPFDRFYAVYRGAEAIATGLSYGTTSFTDTLGANNTAYDYKVKYINTCGEEASTSTVSGTDAYQPATPTITGDSTNTCPATTVALSTESGMSSYQWRKDGNPVGTNSAAYTATESGTYTVSYTNISGCSGTSAGHAVTIQTCAVAPAPDGRGGTSPARGVKSGSDITVTFDSTTCPAPSYNLYYGPLSSVSTYGWTGSVCGITSGSSWTPPSGNAFWIIVGDSGPMESSWGLKRVGGVESQRSTSASGLCGNSLIDTTSTCP